MSSYEPYTPGVPAPEVEHDDVRRTSSHQRSPCTTGAGRSKRTAGLPTFLVPSIVCSAIWLMTDPFGYFWPMWVMFGTGIPVLLGLGAKLR